MPLSRTASNKLRAIRGDAVEHRRNRGSAKPGEYAVQALEIAARAADAVVKDAGRFPHFFHDAKQFGDQDGEFGAAIGRAEYIDEPNERLISDSDYAHLMNALYDAGLNISESYAVTQEQIESGSFRNVESLLMQLKLAGVGDAERQIVVLLHLRKRVFDQIRGIGDKSIDYVERVARGWTEIPDETLIERRLVGRGGVAEGVGTVDLIDKKRQQILAELYGSRANYADSVWSALTFLKTSRFRGAVHSKRKPIIAFLEKRDLPGAALELQSLMFHDEDSVSAKTRADFPLRFEHLEFFRELDQETGISAKANRYRGARESARRERQDRAAAEQELIDLDRCLFVDIKDRKKLHWITPSLKPSDRREHKWRRVTLEIEGRGSSAGLRVISDRISPANKLWNALCSEIRAKRIEIFQDSKGTTIARRANLRRFVGEDDIPALEAALAQAADLAHGLDLGGVGGIAPTKPV
jgi:hypothetical protein